VEIRDFAPILQTQSTQTGDAPAATRLSALPLNGRNFASLTQLIPGSISTSPNAMNTPGRVQGSGSRPQVNGNREQTNNSTPTTRSTTASATSRTWMRWKK
jgi:hypothetical protein